jgi:hypothetical protein
VCPASRAQLAFCTAKSTAPAWIADSVGYPAQTDTITTQQAVESITGSAADTRAQTNFQTAWGVHIHTCNLLSCANRWPCASCSMPTFRSRLCMLVDRSRCTSLPARKAAITWRMARYVAETHTKQRADIQEVSQPLHAHAVCADICCRPQSRGCQYNDWYLAGVLDVVHT